MTQRLTTDTDETARRVRQRTVLTLATTAKSENPDHLSGRWTPREHRKEDQKRSHT